jgi:peptidyl-tRNA hydrolase
MAQAVHAALEFARDFPVQIARWLFNSNNLVVVNVPDEDTLLDLITHAHESGIPRLGVREPDLENTVTAVAFSPGPAAKKLLRSYPLALKELAVM